MKSYSPTSQLKAQEKFVLNTKKVWERLTLPHASIQEPERRRRLRLLSSLLVILELGGIAAIVLTLFVRNSLSEIIIALVSVIVLGFAYGLSRTRHYSLAGSLTLTTIWASVLYSSVLAHNPDYLQFLLLTTLLSSQFLTPRATFLTAVVNVVAILLFAMIQPDFPVVRIVGDAFLVGLTGTFMTMIAALQRLDFKHIEQQACELSYRLVEVMCADEALQKSEARLQLQMERMPIACIVCDTNNHAVSWNPAAERIFGYSFEEVQGKNPNDLIVPEEAKGHVDQVVKRLMEGDTTAHSINENKTKDGRMILCDWSNTPLIENDGRVIGILSMVQDITSRMQAEEALQKSEARLANILENAAEAIIAINKNQEIILFNKGAEKIFGYQADEVLGQPLDLLLPQRFMEAHRKHMQVFSAAGQANRSMGLRGDVVGRRKDGSEFPAQIGISTHGENGHMIFTAIVIDLTERKAAEDRIRAESARAEALIRVAGRLNAQLDLDTVLAAVCEEVAFALNVSKVSIALYDESSGQMVPAAGSGWSEEVFRSLQPLPGADDNILAPRYNPVACFEDVQKIPGFPNLDLFIQEDIHTVLSVSMLREGNLIGGINVFSTGQIREFKEDEISLVKGIVNEAAQAITNARLFKEARDRTSQLNLLYDMGLALNSMLEPHSLLEFLFRIAMDTLNADRAAFYRFNAVQNELTLELNIGYLDKSIGNTPSISIEDERLSSAWVARNLLPLNIPSVQTDPNFLPLVPDTQSLLLAPVVRNGLLMGVLSLARTEPKPFTLQDERLLLLFANQAAVAMENARLFSDAERRLSQVQALQNIDLAIIKGFDLQATGRIILEKVISELQVDAANLLIYDPAAERLDYIDKRGFCSPALQHTHLNLGEGYAGQAALERRTIHIPDLTVELDGLARSPHLPSEGFITYFAVPLTAKDEVKGVLEIFHRSRLDSHPEWLSFLEALAGQAAIAIDNFNLFNNLQTANLELIQSYDETIEGWSRALDLRDKETEGHTQRVTEMTLLLARAMDVSEAELVHVRRGALLHDIGKMGIPDNILLKPGPLTEAEWVIMRRHPIYAYEMLAPIDYLRPAVEIPYCHHEKWDGTGYPRGLVGEEIPFVARIFSVVDVWDAVTSDRPYRPAWSHDRALTYIREQSGKHFDPRVVEVFLKFIDKQTLF